MVNIRQATIQDLQMMQQCNLRNLPENYSFRYYLYHGLCWPQLLHVAEDESGRIVGYVMAKLEEEDEKNKNKPVEAHITSLSVLRTHRKLGIATKLMRAAQHQMRTLFNCDCVSLHVRVTNRAAITLYKDVLGYEILEVDKGYYADKEDAYDMKLQLNKKEEETKATEAVPEGGQQSDSYAESNPEAKKGSGLLTVKQEEESKASKNKKKRDKAKAKK